MQPPDEKAISIGPVRTEAMGRARRRQGLAGPALAHSERRKDVRHGRASPNGCLQSSSSAC